MSQKINIYRYGILACSVENIPDAIMDWFINNVAYHENSTMMIPETWNYEQVLSYAISQGYSIGEGEDNSTFNELEEYESFLKKVKIAVIAKSVMPVTKRGKNYVADCPICGEKHVMAIVPSHNVFKCFRCGATGDAFQLVKAVKGWGERRTMEHVKSVVKLTSK